jgi:hypothetical protein
MELHVIVHARDFTRDHANRALTATQPRSWSARAADKAAAKPAEEARLWLHAEAEAAAKAAEEARLATEAGCSLASLQPESWWFIASSLEREARRLAAEDDSSKGL